MRVQYVICTYKMQLAKPGASSHQIAHETREAARQGELDAADGPLPAFEAAEPSELALRAQDEARRAAADDGEIGASWEADIAAHKALIAAEEAAADEAQKVAGRAAVPVLKAARQAAVSYKLAAFPRPEHLRRAALAALDAATDAVGDMPRPDTVVDGHIGQTRAIFGAALADERDRQAARRGKLAAQAARSGRHAAE